MSKTEDLTQAEQYENFMVPTEHRPYQSIDAIPGIGIKPMNVLDRPAVWSATFRLEAGATLPIRENTALVELLVIRGSGTYSSGAAIAEGDYVREESGQYEPLTAQTEFVFFLTNHGQTNFLDSSEQILWEATPAEIRRLQVAEDSSESS
jgi:hypothetical protein